MTKKISILLLLISAVASAQIRYEKGYFIDNQNQRTECLIRNVDWNDTPSEFEYKLSENDAVMTKKDFEVKEFKVGETKYISLDIAIDQSPDRVDKLSIHKNPEFETRRIFLKVIVDGTASLYHYGRNDLQRYFYNIAGKPIEQLIYKRYLTDEKLIAKRYSSDREVISDISTNNYFKQQLWNNLKCDNTTESSLEKLEYNRNDLKKYFETVNQCKGDKISEVKQVVKKGSFNIKGSVVFGQHSFSIDVDPLFSHDFGKKSYATLGAEFEYIVPFWNNKWGIILEPTFASYKQEDIEGDKKYTIAMKYILVSAGFRHYFFITDKSKIFLNVDLDYMAISGSPSIKYTSGGNNYPPYVIGENSLTFAFGAGYNYERFYVEFRYHPPANPSPYRGNDSVEYKYNNLTLIGRYKFF